MSSVELSEALRKQKKIFRCEECKEDFEIQEKYIRHYVREHTNSSVEDIDFEVDYGVRR